MTTIRWASIAAIALAVGIVVTVRAGGAEPLPTPPIRDAASPTQEPVATAREGAEPQPRAPGRFSTLPWPS